MPSRLRTHMTVGLRRIGRHPAMALCLLALVLPPAALAAQGDHGPVPDVVLLKRIAEAVDGHRTGGLVYVVASLDGDHPVAGVFGNPKEADKALERLGEGYSRFGPFQAPLDREPSQLVGCVHIANTSRMSPMSDQCVPPSRSIRLEDVRRMTLVLGLADGTVDTLPLPRGTDVIMLSLNAFDKFAVPYYLRTLGLAGTSEMRTGFASIYQTGKVPPR
jgi:hypothetical protein